MSEQEQQREYERYQEWAAEREAHEEQQYHIYLEDRIAKLKAQLAEIDKFMASMDTNAGRKKDGYYHEAFETAHAMVKKAIINREKSDE